jgi:hypothetical protein
MKQASVKLKACGGAIHVVVIKVMMIAGVRTGPSWGPDAEERPPDPRTPEAGNRE